MEKYVMFNLAMYLGRSKNVDWKQLILTRSIILMNFLVSKKMLVEVNPFNAEGGLKQDLVIYNSDLTKEGYEFFLKVRPSWSKYLERGGDVNNIEWLEKKCKKEGIKI